MKNLRAIAICTAALAAGSATAQGIGTWDEDGNARLDASEFTSGLDSSGLFDRWDADSDATMSAVELETGLYDAWDQDNDGALSVDEWDAAVDAWFGEQVVDLSVDAWDADGDGAISRIEFVNALRETAFYERFAAEPIGEFAVDEDAFADGLFDTVDLDNDELIGGEEDGLLVELGEILFSEKEEWPGLEPVVGFDDGLDEGVFDGPPLIERGEAFTHLPIPCQTAGQDDSGAASDALTCEALAARFCEALGYGSPIDFVAASGQLHVVRCNDEI